MVILVYSLIMRRQESVQLRKWALLIPLLAVAISFMLTAGTESSLDEAISLRSPIFINSLRMFREHPVNGVGVRAFPVAYVHFADPDDVHLRAKFHRFLSVLG